MISLATFVSPVHDCAYLPGQSAQMTYEVVAEIGVAEYQQRLQQGWRRFGHSLFKPVCPTCRGCQSLRVEVEHFQPDRSQKRAVAANRDVTLTITEPSVSDEKLELYDRFHNTQHDRLGWPDRGMKDPDDYAESFVVNPVATQEWQYRIGERLVGVGYVDQLTDGLSAIYFFHDPDERQRSLGTFNVMSIISTATKLGLPFVYMGYYVSGCRSLEYKARYRPNQVLTPPGEWVPFRG